MLFNPSCIRINHLFICHLLNKYLYLDIPSLLPPPLRNYSDLIVRGKDDKIKLSVKSPPCDSNVHAGWESVHEIRKSKKWLCWLLCHFKLFFPFHIPFVFHCKLDMLYKTTDNEINVVILGDEHSFPSARPFMQGGVRVSLGKMGWLWSLLPVWLWVSPLGLGLFP